MDIPTGAIARDGGIKDLEEFFYQEEMEDELVLPLIIWTSKAC